MLNWVDPKLVWTKGNFGTKLNDVSGNGECISYVSGQIP